MMFDNFWLIVGQLLVLSFVLLFAISLIGVPIVALMNSYANNKHKNEAEQAILISSLLSKAELDEEYTVEDFLKDSKKD